MLAQYLLVSFVSTIDRREVPCAADNLQIGFTGTGNGFEQNEGFDVDPGVAECVSLRFDGVRRDPYAVLEATESPTPQISPQS
jgi:hypothetical protein